MTASIQQQLLEALKKIDRPVTFCTSGELPLTLPGLEVGEPVALPLEKRQVAALKKHAHQAPYGKGTETLVDTKVRRVWEIDADQVVLANPEWPNVVAQAVSTIQTELGLEQQKLEAHLYKLLLYEVGSFFLPHRDGEKLDRMVATLVIALPSAHAGGELVIRHDGREETIDFAPDSRFKLQFAAFYADCEHEVRPVTSGCRLALVYNLTLAKSKKGISAPQSSEHIAAVARLLVNEEAAGAASAGSQEPQRASKLAVLLEHKYSQAGLTFDALKGIDRAKANVLFAAAQQAGYDASLALVTYWENGSAEPTGDYGGYGRRKRYGYYDDDEDDEVDSQAGEHLMGEVYDESLTAEHFRDADDNPLAYDQIPVDREEIVSANPLNEGEPDKEDFEGYTGNAGMTLERWYHWAAVILWPAPSRFDVLCQAGVEAAVGGLEQMIRQWKRAKKSVQPELEVPCRQFATRIIANWPERKYGRGYQKQNTKQTTLLDLLETLGDVELVATWLRKVLAKDASADPGQALGNICKQHGWLTFQSALRELYEDTSHETLERNARLLADLSLRKDKNADRVNLCTQLAQQMMAAIEQWDPQVKERDWQAHKVNCVELLQSVAQSFITLKANDLLERLATDVLDRPKEFDLTTVQVPALLDLEKWLKRVVKHPISPLRRWLTAIVEQLESRASRPPQAPSDWRRESTIGCKCGDCGVLSRFLNDPDTKTLRMPLAKPRRQHLHNIIDGNRLDTTHVTEHRGSPHVLVCTKMTASYDRALQVHHVDLDQLAKTRNILEWHESLTP